MHHTSVLWWMDSGSRIVVDVLAKGLVWLLVMLAVERLCGRRYAAWRSLVWRIACVGLVLLPLSLAVPARLAVPLRPPQARRIVAERAQGFGAEVSSAAQPSAAEAIGKSLRPQAGAPSSAEPDKGVTVAGSWVSSASWPVVGVAVYVLGVCAMLSRLGLALGFVAGLRRSSSEVNDARWIGTLRALEAQLGIGRPLRLVTSDRIDIPVQVGVFRRAIMLPCTLLGRTDRETRESVVAHELAHLLRRDYLLNIVAGIAMALHWPNPVCWLAVRRLRDASEETCDDWAVRLVGGPASYAERLLDLAVQARGRWAAAAVGVHTSVSRVAKRVVRIEMLGGRVRPLVPRVAALVVALVLVGCAAVLGVSSCERREGPRPSTGLFTKSEPRFRKPELAEESAEPKVTATRQSLASAKVTVEPEAVVVPIQAQKVVPSLAQARAQVARAESTVAFRLEARELAEEIAGKKAAPEEDMATELLDVAAMDVGRAEAMILADPTDKRNLEGRCRLWWLYLPRVHNTGASWGSRRFPADWPHEALARPVLRLAEAMNEYTRVHTTVGGGIDLGRLGGSRMPWVYHDVPFAYELMDQELQPLGRYLMNGGFVLAGRYEPVQVWGESAQPPFQRRNLLAAVKTQGIRADFEILPEGHPVYHCFFDVFGQPGVGFPGWEDDTQTPYVYGLEIGGRLVAVALGRPYLAAWGPEERALQFGVNLIVFALTQEGSLAQRLTGSATQGGQP